jgi:hypothetical protein
MDFLAKNQVTKLEHCSDSPHPAQADFYPFARLKSALNGWRFCDATDIIKNETEELEGLSKKWIPGIFPTPLQ